jgi:uncharacterized protein Usg
MSKQMFDERLTTIQIYYYYYYYLLDYQSLLQEFTLQIADRQPDFPRTHQFLWYWKHNIEARIHTIYLAHRDYWGNMTYRNITKEIN